MTAETGPIRLDKWLWFARFFKTRGLSAKTVTAGHVRVNSDKTSKASTLIRPGDVLTFPQGNDIRVIRVLATGSRRGPAPEAQLLYEDLSPKPPKEPDTVSEPASPGRKGRPTKKDRRDLDAFLGGYDE